MFPIATCKNCGLFIQLANDMWKHVDNEHRSRFCNPGFSPHEAEPVDGWRGIYPEFV